MTTRRLAAFVAGIVAVEGALIGAVAFAAFQLHEPAPSLHQRLTEACHPNRLVDWAANDPLGYIPEGMVVATCMGADGPYQKAVLR